MLKTYRNIILEEANYRGLPVMYLPLDEATGTAAADQMTLARGTGYAGTFTGGYTLGALGPISGEASRGVTFNGSTGYVATGTLGNLLSQANTTGLALTAWCRHSPSANRLAIAGSFTSSSNQGIQWCVNSQDVTPSTNAHSFKIIATSGTTDIMSSWTDAANTLNDGNWHHIAVTVAAGLTVAGTKFYQDGVEVQKNAGSYKNGTVLPNNLTVNLAIGARDIGGTRSLYYPGDLAHVVIYNYALSAARVQAHYLAGVNGCNGLRI